MYYFRWFPGSVALFDASHDEFSHLEVELQQFSRNSIFPTLKLYEIFAIKVLLIAICIDLIFYACCTFSLLTSSLGYLKRSPCSKGHKRLSFIKRFVGNTFRFIKCCVNFHVATLRCFCRLNIEIGSNHCNCHSMSYAES